MYDFSEITKLIPSSKELDTNFLSPNLGGVLDDYLVLKCRGTPKESLILALIVKISQSLMLNRVSVTFSETTTPINIYALNFMGSGEGKDKPLKILDSEIMDTYKNMFNEKMRDYIVKEEKKVLEKADDKYKSGRAEKEKFIEQQKPRQLVSELSDATLEGFLAMRQAFATAGFGGTFVKISEFGDYITSQNNSRLEFISAITEIYDFGDSKPKIIKGEREYSEVNGVPSTILFHTSLSGLLEGNANKQLLTFLNRGLGRRCFISCPDPLPASFEGTRELLFQEYKDTITSANNMITDVKQMFSNAIGYTKINNNFRFTEEADLILFDYKLYNHYRASQRDYYEEDALRAELKNRHWKCLKLAGLIAAFEHPKKNEVTTDDLQVAIYITELFGFHLASFFGKQEIEGYQKLYGFLKYNLNKWVSKTDIRSQRFVGKNNFTRWLEENIQFSEELASKDGYTLEKEDNGSRGEKYRLVPGQAKQFKELSEATRGMTVGSEEFQKARQEILNKYKKDL